MKAVVWTDVIQSSWMIAGRDLQLTLIFADLRWAVHTGLVRFTCWSRLIPDKRLIRSNSLFRKTSRRRIWFHLGKSNGSSNSYHRTILDRDSRIMESQDKAVESGRAEFFVSSWDPTVRNSLQAVILGNFFGLNAYSFCYGMISFLIHWTFSDRKQGSQVMWIGLNK